MAKNARRWQIAGIMALAAFSLMLRAQEPSIPASSIPAQSTPAPSTPATSTPEPAVQPQTPASAAQAAGIVPPAPLAIVPVDGVQLSGAMQVADGKATIGSSGSVTAGEKTAVVTLPGRGEIKLCATTRMSLSADKSIAASLGPGETPGLMMALDRGAVETSFDTGRNSDVILTPDFRITISGPGRSSVQVRLGEKGDTCVDNRGPNAPYVTVSGVFESGFYRVQDGQRVLFEHGSLREVVDREKESCGCPEEPVPTVVAHASSNPFPVAQSAGLAPMKTPPLSVEKPGVQSAQATATLRYNGDEPKQPEASVTTAEPQTSAATAKPATKATPPKGFFGRLGHFFRTLFGG